MTHVVSVCMSLRKVAAVRQAPKGRRQFASSHLVGKFHSGGSINGPVRATLARRGREKNC